MNENNIAGIDLNLLVVFDAMMTERHVTRAAKEIGLTQPAVSHALNRLRLLLSDPLFVRTPQGMLPSPLAQELGTKVRSVLSQVGGILNRQAEFIPGSSHRVFSLGLSDYVAAVVVPGLLRRMKVVAPYISLVVKNANYGTGIDLIENGQVELAAGSFPIPPAYIKQELLFNEGFVCAGRRGLTGLRRRFSRKRYLAFEHMQVSSRGEPYGYVDAVLAKDSLTRNIKITVGQFLLAPIVLLDSDLLATEPRRLFTGYADRLQLRPPPFPIPEFEVLQMWHSRYEADPGHVWLRGMLREVARRT